MKMTQVKHRKPEENKHRKPEEEETPPVPQEAPKESQEASKDAEDLLEEIECCLAEAELDSEKALKAQAIAEWYMIRPLAGYNERNMQIQVWVAKYGHLFSFCCGIPVFDD